MLDLEGEEMQSAKNAKRAHAEDAKKIQQVFEGWLSSAIFALKMSGHHVVNRSQQLRALQKLFPFLGFKCVFYGKISDC